MQDETTPQDSAAMPPASVGSVQPVAWAAVAPDASESRAIFWSSDEAEKVCGRYGYDLFPLYAVRLTGREREALLTVRDIYASHDDDDSCADIASAIDGLLERLR